MTLNSNSKLVRWAYFFARSTPDYTTLCAFFWRAFVFIPLMWLGIGAAVFGLLDLVVYHGFYKAPLASLLATLWMIWGVIVPMDHSKTIERFVDSVVERADATVFVQGVKSIKNKFCPIIELKRD